MKASVYIRTPWLLFFRFCFCLSVLQVFTISAFGGLVWKKITIDYKAKVEDESVTALYHFANTGREPIEILSTKSSCGCTVASLEKETYAPGELGTLKATFTFDGRVGHQTKNIQVLTSDTNNVETILTLNVDIPEFLSVEPQMLYWTQGSAPTTKTINVKVLAGIPVDIKSLQMEGDRFVSELITVEPGKSYKVNITPKATDRGVESQVKLMTNIGKENPRFAFVVLKIY